MNWDLFMANAQSVSYFGTDIHGVTGATAGDWSAMVVLSTAQISAFTDTGVTPSKVALNTDLPAGTFISANGAFSAVTTTAGTLALYRKH